MISDTVFNLAGQFPRESDLPIPVPFAFQAAEVPHGEASFARMNLQATPAAWTYERRASVKLATSQLRTVQAIFENPSLEPKARFPRIVQQTYYVHHLTSPHFFPGLHWRDSSLSKSLETKLVVLSSSTWAFHLTRDSQPGS